MSYDVFELIRNAESLTGRAVAGSFEERVREDYRAGIFHSAEARRADNQSQLFIRIRRDCLAEKCHSRRGRRKSLWRISRVFPRHIIREGSNGIFTGIDLRSLAERNHHAVGGDWLRLFELPCRWPVSFSGD